MLSKNILFICFSSKYCSETEKSLPKPPRRAPLSFITQKKKIWKIQGDSLSKTLAPSCENTNLDFLPHFLIDYSHCALLPTATLLFLTNRTLDHYGLKGFNRLGRVKKENKSTENKSTQEFFQTGVEKLHDRVIGFMVETFEVLELILSSMFYICCRIDNDNQLFSKVAKRWRWEYFSSWMSTEFVCILPRNSLSAPSFGRYWKQLIRSPYWKVEINRWNIKLFSNKISVAIIQNKIEFHKS